MSLTLLGLVFKNHGSEGVEGLALRRWGEGRDVAVGQRLLLQSLAEGKRGLGKGQLGGNGVELEVCDDGAQRRV